MSLGCAKKYKVWVVAVQDDLKKRGRRSRDLDEGLGTGFASTLGPSMGAMPDGGGEALVLCCSTYRLRRTSGIGSAGSGRSQPGAADTSRDPGQECVWCDGERNGDADGKPVGKDDCDGGGVEERLDRRESYEGDLVVAALDALR